MNYKLGDLLSLKCDKCREFTTQVVIEIKEHAMKTVCSECTSNYEWQIKRGDGY